MNPHLLGEAGVRLGHALGRFLEGQGCVPVDQQEEEICGWRSGMSKDAEGREAADRGRRWKEGGGDMAGGYMRGRGWLTLFPELALCH